MSQAHAAADAIAEAPLRLLLVHAHPDDETINCGATMAMYAAQGVAVTLVTCTLGDEGEILVPSVAHLAAGRDDRLGEYRHGELDAAMTALGITDVRLLGGAGRWRDSGMAGSPANDNPDCFMRASMETSADLISGDHARGSSAVVQLAQVLLDVRPQVVVTYDSNGGYGHPDHIKAHDVTHAAVTAVRDQWSVSKVYACARRRVVEEQDRHELARLGDAAPFAVGSDDFDWAVEDSAITTAIDASAFSAHKQAAMRAHATQVAVSADGDWYSLSDGIGARLHGVEYFTCVVGEAAGATDADGFETDLFAGIR